MSFGSDGNNQEHKNIYDATRWVSAEYGTCRIEVGRGGRTEESRYGKVLDNRRFRRLESTKPEQIRYFLWQCWL